MLSPVEKKLRTVRIVSVTFFVLMCISWAWLMFLAINGEKSPVIPCLIYLCSIFFITEVSVFFAYHRPLGSSIKRIKKSDNPDLLEDISLDFPTLFHLGVFCGKEAMFCNKNYNVVPYANIAWVHVYEERRNGHTLRKLVVLRTTDGKKMSIPMHQDEVQWLINRYIAPNSPNLILGYGTEQKKRYYLQNSGAVIAKNKVKRIWGICLLLLSILLTISNIANQTILSPVIGLIAGFFISGIILILLSATK